MRSKIIVVQQRRKKEGKTDYKKRLKLLLSGKPRLVIRKSLNSIWLQVIEYFPEGDKVVLSAHSNELKKLGWKFSCSNLPASYLTGFLLGKKAGEKKVKQCILDSGLYPSIKGNRIYAALNGAVDAGMDIPVSREILPSKDRIEGKNIADFAKKVKESKGKYGNQFSKNYKENANPEDITKQFNEVKQRIEGKKND